MTNLDEVKEKYNLNTDVVENVATETKAAESTTEAKAEPTEVEKEAISLGWDPNKADGVDAKEFIRVGKIVERAREKERNYASKEINELKQTINAFDDHIKKTESAAYQKALRDIQTNMKLAEESLDFESYKNLSNEYNNVNQEFQKLNTTIQKPANTTVQSTPEVTASIKSFETRNKEWYNADNSENIAMSAFAIACSSEIHKADPNLPPDKELAMVEDRVRKQFPHRFANAKREEPLKVESRGSDSSGVTNSADDIRSLTPQQQQIWRMISKNSQSKYTLKDYIKHVKLQQNEVK